MALVEKNPKIFDFSKFPKRKIALMFLYIGCDFDGLVVQKNSENTIEEHMFRALLKGKLIKDREGCGWTRCGRTDKGVSAFRQVSSLIVRSTDTSRTDIFWEEKCEVSSRIKSIVELPYTKILNSNLPKTIRVLAFSPVQENFNARHSCSSRTYIYFLPRANIDLTRINDACGMLIGTHDFRNFCHIDKSEDRLEKSYVRKIEYAHVENFTTSNGDTSRYDILRLTVKASGFLWHQIRCIVTLIYEIAVGREQLTLITNLLDINKNPARPQYNLANELPLCLFDCDYSVGEFDWQFDLFVINGVLMSLNSLWAEYQIKSSLIKSMIDGITAFNQSGTLDGITAFGTQGLENFVLSRPSTGKYVLIEQRLKCDSLENKREKLSKKRKID